MRYLSGRSRLCSIASVGVGGLVQARQGIRLGMDGRIYLAGATDSNLLVARFNTSGYLDTSFGTSGVASVAVGMYMDAADAIDIGPDGKVTIAGGADDGVSGNFVTARFTVADIPRRIFVQQDANHNVTSLTDLYGAMLERFVEDPYGDRVVLTPSFTSTTDVYNMVYGFQGGRFTPADGLYHFNARDYDVNLGRWISQDPIGYPDGANAYQADLTNPLVYVDPNGTAARPQPTTMPNLPAEFLRNEENRAIDRAKEFLRECDEKDKNRRRSSSDSYDPSNNNMGPAPE